MKFFPSSCQPAFNLTSIALCLLLYLIYSQYVGDICSIFTKWEQKSVTSINNFIQPFQVTDVIQ